MCNAVRHQFLILFILFPLFTDNLRNTRFLFFSLCFFSSLNLYFHLIPFFLYLKSCLSLDISRFLFFRVYSLFRPFIFPLASLLFFFSLSNVLLFVPTVFSNLAFPSIVSERHRFFSLIFPHRSIKHVSISIVRPDISVNACIHDG